ncbi:arsenate reductase (azurin) large subunit [Pinisolibacter aquiterrae]|uniref:arsenate reductase (azurin) large subunit n=1 Tax=Pinisolibacter aquiterrae TaxID=2815579 RepID=UPI001C3C3559|nr:arsenate reductase (azurin) large subunit [Pinisolibacter aquiterrae]MBV5262466.1 arsenate reductase (azurin) large subunit [Pinisolibacter aquiterrae]MCC8235898.1 arsenate reductase (azurin) large subunit [Pinisolibacter aquiterrae]
MTFKRQVDRLPIIPADAKEHNVTCHYCIVGCGYKAYTWDVNKQGGTAPAQNKFGVDLSKQQGAETPAWYAPSMYNIVKQGGRDVHLVIKPDPACAVNSGLGSVRGARMAENHTSQARGTQQQRLTDPMVWRYGEMQPTTWDDALDLVARVTAAVIDEQGEDGLFVSMFDHGGSAGGYENTWGTGKLYFGAMKIKNVRIHNRPAYNSEVHATRDMGVGELNNCYEDAELADTIMVVGANPLEAQTNYFLNHWIPNLRGTSIDKKKKEFPGEPVEQGRIIIVDPRRTVTVAACEAEAGADRVLHLAIEPGTDLVLFNGLLTHIVDKGWIDKDFIQASTVAAAAGGPQLIARPGAAVPERDHELTDFAAAVAANRTTLSECARLTGLREADIVKAAEWIAMPKAGGKRRRTMIGYEKGLIWGNDNYRTNGALVNIALATGNVGRPGGGVVRLGGHQEGYVRPSDAHVGRPAAYVDELLIEGRGGIHHIWACDHYKTTLNAMRFKQTYKKRTDMVKDAMNTVPWGDRDAMVAAIMTAIRQGGLFSVDVDIVPTQIGQASHVWLPAAIAGEMNLTSMNGERRMRLTERYMDPPGRAMPDCLIAARIANNLERVFRAGGKAGYADRFKGFDWKTEEEAFVDGYVANAGGGRHVTYERLRAMGTDGFHEPAVDFKDGRIVGTKRLYADGKFSTKDGKAKFLAAPWRGWAAPGKAEQKAKFPYLVNNGRANVVWQNAFMDRDNDFVMGRMPFPVIEMNPDDMKELSVAAGDLVEVYNDAGATQAMVYPTPTARRKQTFMLFGFPTGVAGNVVNAGVNELVIPDYKHNWAGIRKIAAASSETGGLSFKAIEYKA